MFEAQTGPLVRDYWQTVAAARPWPLSRVGKRQACAGCRSARAAGGEGLGKGSQSLPEVEIGLAGQNVRGATQQHDVMKPKQIEPTGIGTGPTDRWGSLVLLARGLRARSGVTLLPSARPS
jgi:hypothetical protein